MGEWSEYFEDFPEENPANWIDGRYDPIAAPAINSLRAQQEDAARLEEENLQIARKTAENRLKLQCPFVVGNCPQCGFNKLYTYKFSDCAYLCECQECGIYGRGETSHKAFEETAAVLGEGRDWRED